MQEQTGGLVRPDVTASDAIAIARELWGIVVTASELGSNQDRNFLLTEPDGSRSVLRIDNPAFPDSARDAQHAALDAYRAAGVPVPAALPGGDGALTQRWRGFAVRRSAFAEGEAMVDAGYFAPVVLREFGSLAAASVNALAALEHPGLDRPQMWDMRVAAEEARNLLPSIADPALRDRVSPVIAAAEEVLRSVAAELPVQPIHGDLTDDNVMGVRGADSRLHPRTVLDLGDLALGWRVAELAVCASSMLHHEPERPLRVLETIAAFHAEARLSEAEAKAVWPLIALRAALLVASGWRQLEIDGDNAYARERIAGEQAIFDAATAVPLVEAVEQVLAALGFPAAAAQPSSVQGAAPLAPLLPELAGEVVVLDPGTESEGLASGAWLAPDAEGVLIRSALAQGAAAAVMPYGVYRLTRTMLDSTDAAATWPIGTSIHLPAGPPLPLVAPVSGRIVTSADEVMRITSANGWRCEIRGAQSSSEDGAEVAQGDGIGRVPESAGPRTLVVTVVAEGAEAPVGGTDDAPLVEPDRVPAWRRLSTDPAAILGLPAMSQSDDAAGELARRARIFASAQERYYERPPQIERGWRHHLVDTTGRAYVDMVNNVTGLGHGHPRVADAVNRQIRILNTNSRFLYRELAEYSERLLALVPERPSDAPGDRLDTVLLVNSGSEAVDLALRLAQAATGRKTIVSLREAYHGWTMASDAVTTSAYDNPDALATRPDWVHVADVPNRFRGTYRGEETGARYAADLGADLDRLAAEGRPVAGFICESVLGNAGGVMLPEGYLAEAYARVRGAGGLCIADEVQVGFGRMGSSFWGFEQSAVSPDIITIAKPMGNGYPIGGVITSKRVADALAAQGQFFSSAGGNPLSCRVGIAVLDAMAEEGLQENARVVGARLAEGFRALAERHRLIGPVHGEGLYLGVELVRDRESMEPAAAEAAAICERLRELGVIVQTTSERSNVLKIKPPLCLTARSADLVVAAVDRVLTEGW
ncbi:aminotransferase [Microbacterium azadirachtae]|uniref:5-aminovalerate aminotransferase DavT n=1 Tax=Microbacterium azadirachtae TaxID=582680 RepID=A0A0F0LVH1_9MICO|nr:aminotransferase [Microbacterium azadirachtae]KJL36295.1 5-aminovalerate aminotransferase DavT [Microbacterium azadirachtae]